ncbi:hypothetical protein RFM26_02785 [Mesorhizobium sp. VK23B]|uniref:Uncharacterized protein n=1 Tax=Mesorhizobium dulcispinae TaxID=3072316 RepID=A0ABU4X876_9HYPH|nr:MULTISPECIES: hypothetical protein [unclassified Mesorhizobium]MDX8464611.1 hypothetical protein [Mesorhizobium sp. VK23B]MDX8470997.1 hypothetical protein [Mesorhizobium sp. VK23A]
MSRLLFLSAGAILALTSAASAAPATQPLKISKECSQFTGDTPSFCTITESNLAAIPAGTKIFYYGPVIGSPLFTSSTAVIAVGNGDSAVGYCVVYDTASPPIGTCAFHAGSGTLAGFQAVVTVTVDDKQIWHWDGCYLLGTAK